MADEPGEFGAQGGGVAEFLLQPVQQPAGGPQVAAGGVGGRVRMAGAAAGPEHTADAEQVWMLTAGALEFTVDGETRTATAGEAVVLPAGALRQVRTAAAAPAAEAFVATRAGCRVHAVGEPAPRPLPWAR